MKKTPVSESVESDRPTCARERERERERESEGEWGRVKERESDCVSEREKQMATARNNVPAGRGVRIWPARKGVSDVNLLASALGRRGLGQSPPGHMEV